VSGARILVVDDSAVIRSVLRKHLVEQGYTVEEAVDGVAGLQACRDALPDVVLLDIEMPALDGHGVLTELQADPATKHIPVVFLTARTSTEDVVEGLRIGAHDYLRKPFEPSELIARVSAACRVKELEDELRRRNAELEELSRTDPLTGLANRRHLQEHLTITAAIARRHDGSMSVLMIDVDHFKRVNDTYGHEVGDTVLREIAIRMGAACRTEDLLGRWGGEEFLLVAPATDVDGAAEVGERVRAAVSSSPIDVPGGGGVTVTVSIGAAEGHGEIDELLRVADTALYAAKAGGRDRLVRG
jgi:two-component system, cell cycle response regulator